MTQWATCTHTGGNKIYVNLDNTASIYRDDKGARTVIKFAGGGETYVQEAPGVIFAIAQSNLQKLSGIQEPES